MQVAFPELASEDTLQFQNKCFIYITVVLLFIDICVCVIVVFIYFQYRVSPHSVRALLAHLFSIQASDLVSSHSHDCVSPAVSPQFCLEKVTSHQFPETLIVTRYGDCYHLFDDCSGLASARGTRHLRRCAFCGKRVTFL